MAYDELTDKDLGKIGALFTKTTSSLQPSYFCRLQHGFLLSSTHQILDKLVTETQETMSMRQGSLEGNLIRLLEDAENCKQLLPKLQESVRCDPHPIEVRLGKMKVELNSTINNYLQV